MTAPRNKSGKVIEIRPAEANLAVSETATLLQTEDLELVRLTVPAGQDVPTHELQGEIVLQCLEGHVSIAAMGRVQELRPDQLLYYRANEPISVQGMEDAVLLVTLVRRRSGERVELIG
jgi:quercetin dioxygenase-like cupin family protein